MHDYSRPDMKMTANYVFNISKVIFEVKGEGMDPKNIHAVILNQCHISFRWQMETMVKALHVSNTCFTFMKF